MVGEAVRAALGAPQGSAQPERLAWVDVLNQPEMVAIDDPATGEPLGTYARFDDERLTDVMADKARSVCDLVDAASCEADHCVASPYEHRGQPVGAAIGWVLVARSEFFPFTLIQRGRDVIVTCIDCSPSAVYKRLMG